MNHKRLPTILLSLAPFIGTPSLPASPERIVTVGGAATEIVFALGSGDAVVATDLSSIYPPEARELPMVGYVRNISPEGVVSMEPDLVVATGSFGPATAREMIERLKVEAIWLPELLSSEDLSESIRKVSETLDKSDLGEAMIAEINEELASAADKAAIWQTDPPSVLFLLEPIGPSNAGMGGGLGSKANVLIEMAGGINAGSNFYGFKPISAESLIAMNPDVILVGQSENHGGSPESINAMVQTSSLGGVSAIKAGRVHGVPLDDLAFGPRLGEAVLRWNALIAEAAQ